MPATGFHSAIVLHGPKDLRVERRQRRPPSDGQVQVSIQATGLCGSDLHYYIHGKNGDFAVKSPLVLGHEAAGIITHIGPNVPPHLNLRVGDRVAIEPGAPCGRCSSPTVTHRQLGKHGLSTREKEGEHVSLSSVRNSAVVSDGAGGADDTDEEGTAVNSNSDVDSSSDSSSDIISASLPSSPTYFTSQHAHTVDEDEDEDDIQEESDDDEDGGCEFCEMGRYNLCERMRFCSSAKSFPHLDGTLQTCMNHPARLLHKLPDSCSFEQAALAEPLSVVLHAARRIGLVSSPSNLTHNDNTTATTPIHASSTPRLRPKRVLIIGAGAVGFLAAALVRTLSALGESTAPVSFIAAMDLDKGKLDTLMDAGYADAVYHVTSPVVSQRAGGKVGGMTREEGLLRSRKLAKEALAALSVDDRGAIKGYDVVFECTGVESCIQTAILMARTGGKVALVGMGYPNPYLPLSSAMLREVDLVGVFRYANTWPDALRLLASKTMLGIEDVMVTQRFALEETGQAFKILAGGSGSGRGTGETVIKIMVGPNYGSGMKGRVGVVASP